MQSGKRKRRTKAELARARAKALSARKHHLRVTHSMDQQIYDDILAFQEGVCRICLRPPSPGKNLHIDHDHNVAKELCDHPHEKSCPRCWRGLVHRHCNDLLSNVRDSQETLLRAVDFLKEPPAQQWLAGADRLVADDGTRDADDRTGEARP